MNGEAAGAGAGLAATGAALEADELPKLNGRPGCAGDVSTGFVSAGLAGPKLKPGLTAAAGLTSGAAPSLETTCEAVKSEPAG